ncbi:hypothetical protein GGI07_001519 [Coemansia sp. Benny D115]|nr:hypothetical protein GGI07_001519 [Coemansia sp. Benny D115]
MNPAYSLSSSAVDELSETRRRLSASHGDPAGPSLLFAASSGHLRGGHLHRRMRSASTSHMSSADSICSVSTEFLPRMSGTIGRPPVPPAQTPRGDIHGPLTGTGSRIRRHLRSLKRRLSPRGGTGVGAAASWKNRDGADVLNDSIATIFSNSGALGSPVGPGASGETTAVLTGDPEYRLPRNLRPSSLFHLSVRYDTATNTNTVPAQETSAAQETGAQQSKQKVQIAAPSTAAEPAHAFAFSPSAGLPPVPATAPVVQGRCFEQPRHRAMLLSYDAGSQDGGLRSFQAAVDTGNGAAPPIFCCCCNHHMGGGGRNSGYGKVSNSSRTSNGSGGSKGLLSPIHSLMPSFTGSAHFVHTEAGPALDVSEQRPVHTMCPCHSLGRPMADGDHPPGLAGQAEEPLPLMRIKLQPRGNAATTNIASLHMSETAIDSQRKESVPGSRRASLNGHTDDHCSPAQPAQAKARATEKARDEQRSIGDNKSSNRNNSINSSSNRNSNININSSSSSNGAAQLPTRHPEYLRLSTSDSQQPSLARSESEATESSSGTTSNHLLLSGIEPEFGSSRIFTRPDSPPKALSQGSEPEDLDFSSLAAAVAVHRVTSATTFSDSMSFCTALSSLSNHLSENEEEEEEDDDDDDDENMERYSQEEIDMFAKQLVGALDQVPSNTQNRPSLDNVGIAWSPSPAASPGPRHRVCFDLDTDDSNDVSCADTNVDGHSSAHAHTHGNPQGLGSPALIRSAPTSPPTAPSTPSNTGTPTSLRPAILSPQTPRSVPVVEQARKARHPVYRFGALANETFESGRHQDAFDLYTWALLLLSPQQGSKPRDLLARESVCKELEKLGWRVDALEKPPVLQACTASRKNSISEEVRDGQAAKKVADPQQNSESAGRKAWMKLSRSGNGGSGSWWSSSRTKNQQQQQQQQSKSSSQKNVPPPLPLAPATCEGAVVINEPLPAELGQPQSGRFEFSDALLEQLAEAAKEPQQQPLQQQLSQQQQQQQPTKTEVERTLTALERRPEAVPSAPENVPPAMMVASEWAMDAGDEKNDICALLYSNRSAAAYALGKYTAAASDAAASISLRPQWAKGHFRRGEALLALGRVREAHQSYRRAALLEPQDMHVRVSCERARILAQNESMGLRVVQLLAGRDFAIKPRGLHPIRAGIFRFAQGMQNFVYLIADEESRKCVVVDACWDVDGILAVVEREKLLLAAAAVTHGHFDHTGGMPPPPFASLRIRVSGVAELKRRYPHLPLLVHPLDIPEVIAANPQLRPRHFTPTPNGFSFRLGSRTELSFMHTPGHTPGSQCLLVNDCRLFSGDTLFPGSCGRVDLKGGSLPDMLESLRTRLGQISDHTIVYPGHEYGGEWTSIGREKKRGFLRPGAYQAEQIRGSVSIDQERGDPAAARMSVQLAPAAAAATTAAASAAASAAALDKAASAGPMRAAAQPTSAA